jgi:hypothetical protein
MVLHGRAPDGRHGDWVGEVPISPGAADIQLPDRIAPDEAPVIEVVTQTTRPTAYVEVDDDQGRAWGGFAPFAAGPMGAPRAVLHVPRLAPGLYWAIAADSPEGAAKLETGTSVRPFFVAASDEAALRYGTGAGGCVPARDDAPQALSVCLALAPARRTPRWVALEGLSHHASEDATRRSFGLAMALVAIVVAAVLEALLIARAAMRARGRLQAAANEEEGVTAPIVDERGIALVAMLAALLGFALLAAFVARMR